MQDKKMGLSLKYKLLVLLTAIPVVSLSIYISLATRLFESDKIAYVKDSSVAVAKSLAVQFRMEVMSFVEKVKPVIESYNQDEQKFSDLSRDLFGQQDRLDALILIQRAADGQYVRRGELVKGSQVAEEFLKNAVDFQREIKGIVRNGLLITGTAFSDMHLVIGTLIGDPREVNHFVALGLYRASDLHAAFTKSQIYRNLLVDRAGQVLLGPQDSKIDNMALQEILKSTLPEGALEVESDKPQIVSYANTGVSDMRIASVVNKEDALSAVNALLLQSLLFFLALIASTVIISVIASIKLTSALRDLYEATKKVAKGQFDVRVNTESNDEVGGLAEGFNFMAAEVSRLMIETQEKARMASELKTVKVVQETLFPDEKCKMGPFQIIGHFEPASECGGDWWNYSRVGDKLYLWIGDATGHGAPAAMVTSAAKSAVTIIEDLPLLTPGKALEIMNRAIHETSKGKILMTFFVASVDLKTGELVYANASHEPPYLIHNAGIGKKILKRDLIPLVEVNGPRLGDKRSSSYPESKIHLSKGDLLLFYTDGIIDLKNSSGKAWGERGFVKSVCDSVSVSGGVENKIIELKSKIRNYRQESELVDDITLMMCEYGEAS